jgi:acetylornithine deacetylase/succinyl-diaminopimelate desuccinylase-like protein
MHSWTEADEELLLQLLATDTVTPMEADRLGNMAHAQQTYAECARQVGFAVVHSGPPPARILSEPDTPVSVRERAAHFGSEFFEAQPNLVLRLGTAPVDKTLLFNFHMDTVADIEPACRRDGVLFGRGAADAKGLGVAVLAAVRRALELRPDIPEEITILIQCVGGEEGGALGAYGTKHLVREGYLGRLNIVCEPTEFAYFDRTAAAMTARISVAGEGSSDDEPLQGQNATILLAALTDILVRELSPRVLALGAKMCVGGLYTGAMHNRVYGSGQLLLNFAYPSVEVALELEALVETSFAEAVERFRRDYAQYAIAAAAAAAARSICSLTWIKRRLPVLSNRDRGMEAMLRGVGIPRHEVDSTSLPFSCDAMWMTAPRSFTIVYGPGHLGRNKTHATGEFIEIADLDAYAHQLSNLILAFAEQAH